MSPFPGENILRLCLYALLLTLAILFLVRWSILRPIFKMAEWIRQIRSGQPEESLVLPKSGLFAPLTHEVRRLARNLMVARAAAEEEARLRHAGESRWTPERLKEHVRAILQRRPLLVVSNREPYMHVRQGRQIRCVVPASGLVTAMEPILRTCGGTWVAHGSGDADLEMVDSRHRIQVPPEEPVYALRRVWLNKEEEAGYYYGFSNEGLWPLCHIAQPGRPFALRIGFTMADKPPRNSLK